MLGSRLSDITKQLEVLRNIATTGKKLNQPSDDPAAIRPVFSTRKEISNVDRNLNTMGQALDTMQSTDSALNTVENTMQRAKELMTNAVNGSLTDQDRTVLADELAQLKSEMLDTANSMVNGKYIFAGYNITTKPFVENPNYDATTYDPNNSATWPVLYKGDGNATSLDITTGRQVEVNVTGNNLFLGTKTWTPDPDQPTPPPTPLVPGNNKIDTNRYDIFAQLTQAEAAIRNFNPNAPSVPGYSTASVTGAPAIQGVAGVTAVAAKQTVDLTGISVAAGEVFTFTIDGGTAVYTNGTGGTLTGAALVTDIAAQLSPSGASNPITGGGAGSYIYSANTVPTTLNITQAAGSEKPIVLIATANQTAGNGQPSGSLTGGVAGVAAVTAAAEKQGFDLSAVTVKDGENFTFTIPGVNQTINFSNISGSDLTGANLATAIAAQLGNGANRAVGTAGNYTFAVDAFTTTLLNVTQSPGNESNIGNITTTVNSGPPKPGSLEDLQKALQDSLTGLEGGADQNRLLRSQLGNRTNLVETTMTDQQSVSADLQQILSRYQDADVIKSFNDVTQQETAFQAALSITGQVSKLSILDYI